MPPPPPPPPREANQDNERTLPAPAPPWTSRAAPRAPRNHPRTAYTQAITKSRRPLRRVRGRAHHGGEGHRAQRDEGAKGGIPSLPYQHQHAPSRPLPSRPALDVAPRAPRGHPRTAYTQAITDSRRPLRRVRGRAHHGGEGRTRPVAPHRPPNTPWQTGSGRAGAPGARRPNIRPYQPHSVRTTSPLQKHDTSTRRGAEAGTRRQTRKKRVGGGVPWKGCPSLFPFYPFRCAHHCGWCCFCA